MSIKWFYQIDAGELERIFVKLETVRRYISIMVVHKKNILSLDRCKHKIDYQTWQFMEFQPKKCKYNAHHHRGLVE
jgi:hypothetical protein